MENGEEWKKKRGVTTVLILINVVNNNESLRGRCQEAFDASGNDLHHPPNWSLTHTLR